MIACTFPGKHGDLLWALPTVRAVAEAVRTPVDLFLGAGIGGLQPLLAHQWYLRSVTALESWVVQDTAPASPRMPPEDACGWADYAHVFHLGYRGWPKLGLPFETEHCLWSQWPEALGPHPHIDLHRPWITNTQRLPPADVCVGFTDEYFELKYGLVQLLREHKVLRIAETCAPKSRWADEGNGVAISLPWIYVAAQIVSSKVFLGDCSALHVLACALGKRCVIMEPNEQRHNPIFWPYGMDGPQVTIVRGLDGRPTFDARHVRDAVEAALRCAS